MAPASKGALLNIHYYYYYSVYLWIRDVGKIVSHIILLSTVISNIRYSRLVVNHPIVFIVANISLACILGPVTVFTVGLPDFSEPLLVGSYK